MSATHENVSVNVIVILNILPPDTLSATSTTSSTHEPYPGGIETEQMEWGVDSAAAMAVTTSTSTSSSSSSSTSKVITNAKRIDTAHIASFHNQSSDLELA